MEKSRVKYFFHIIFKKKNSYCKEPIYIGVTLNVLIVS